VKKHGIHNIGTTRVTCPEKRKILNEIIIIIIIIILYGFTIVPAYPFVMILYKLAGFHVIL